MTKFVLTFCSIIVARSLLGAVTVVGASVEPNGWVLDVWLNTSVTNAAFDFRWLTNNILSNNPALTLNFKSPGYLDDGLTNNLSRVCYGTKQLQFPYPNQATNDVRVDGANVKVRLALSKTIHALDWGLTLDVATNWYATNDAITSLIVTNTSVIPWPRVLEIEWMILPYELTGNTLDVRVRSMHASAQQFRPLRSIHVWAVGDNGNRTPTNIITLPSLITEMQGKPWWCWQTDLDCTALAQGEKATLHAKAFPWWGTNLDTSVSPFTTDGPDFAPLTFYSDKNGTWKKVYAIVDQVNGTSTGWAWTNSVPCLDPTNRPFQFITQAINAAAGTNNTQNGTNTHSAITIYLTNLISSDGVLGHYRLFGGGSISSLAAPATWTKITARPDVDWTQVYISTNASAESQTGEKTLKIKYEKVVFSWTNNVALVNQGYGWNAFTNCKFLTNLTANGAIVAFHTNAYVVNCDIDHIRNGISPPTSTLRSTVRIWGNRYRGFTDDAQTTTFNPRTFVGNWITPSTHEQYRFQNDQNLIYDPFDYGDNFYGKCDQAVYLLGIGITAATDITNGYFIGNNVFEITKTGSGIPWDVQESQNDNEFITNALSWHNTSFALYHPPYEIANKTNRTLVDYHDVNNFIGDLEVSYDIGSTDGDNTNRWARLYSVNCSGNSVSEINLAALGWPSAGLGFNGINSSYYTNNLSFYQFYVNGSTYGGNTNGNSNAKMHITSPANNLARRQLRQVLRFDLNGTERTAANNIPGAYVLYPESILNTAGSVSLNQAGTTSLNQ